MQKSILDDQLKAACQLTGAAWAVWLVSGNGWEVIASCKSSRRQVAEIVKWLEQPENSKWLAGILGGKRSRSRLIPEMADLPSSKIHPFVDGVTQRIIIVGAEELSGVKRNLWHALATVILNVEQYQLLTATVAQLTAARSELQERITTQREMESKLIQAAKLAAIGEMAAGIAHELNNPMTTVSGFAELILEGQSNDSPIRHELELILRESRRASDVVRRLLDFSRQGESVRALSNINDLINDVLALVSHLIRSTGTKITTELSDQIPLLLVDRNQIKQVILNLIHNSLHAMPDGGQLSITTECRERDNRNWLAIKVIDTGIGIPPKNIKRVFEPFFTTRADEGGTGLGLSVSYGIVKDHGGMTDVESRVGKGSTFTVWLPIEEDL